MKNKFISAALVWVYFGTIVLAPIRVAHAEFGGSAGLAPSDSGTETASNTTNDPDTNASPTPKGYWTCKSGCKHIYDQCEGPKTDEQGNTTPLTEEEKQACKNRANVVHKHCKAIDSADEGVPILQALMALDFFASSGCIAMGIVSLTPAQVGANVLYNICAGAAYAASAAELALTIATSQNTMNIVSALGGAAGTAIASVVALAFTKSAETIGDRITNLQVGQSQATAGMFFTGALYGILGALKMQSINDLEDTQDKECKKAENLMNSALVGQSSGSGGSTEGLGGTAEIKGHGGGTSLKGSRQASDTRSKDAVQCIANSGISNCLPSVAAAKESDVLSKSGLDKIAAQNILEKGIDPAALAKIAKEQGVGAAANAVGQAMGLSSEGTQALAALAQEGLKLNPDALGSSIMTAGGGGGAKTGGGDSGMPDLAALFGGGQQGGPTPASVGSMAFGKNKGPDIWHTGTDKNIFEIVSTKIEKVTNRVK